MYLCILFINKLTSYLYSSSDYVVLSEFTLALFEDSGWYKANYTALYDLQQNPLQWGKGRFKLCVTILKDIVS